MPPLFGRIDHIGVAVEDVDAAIALYQESFEMARLAARSEGLACGISSGAAISAAFRLAAQDEWAGKLIVTIVPSFAERYLSTALFEGL